MWDKMDVLLARMGPIMLLDTHQVRTGGAVGHAACYIARRVVG